jgi:tetratricopeptide (TPR) repeat protein
MLALPSFGLWTAAALLDGTGVDPAAALSQLAASSMIELAEPGLRYRFHDLTRDYAADRAWGEYAGQDGGVAMITQACRALLTLTRRAHAGLYGGDFEVVHSDVPDWAAPPAVREEVDADPLAWFETERLNIRAAVSRCADLGLAGLCWNLAVSAHEFYTIGGYFDDWRATHTIALRACRQAGDLRGEGIVLACLGQPALVASGQESVPALAELERSVHLLGECGDDHGQAIAMRTLANALRRSGHLDRPLKLFTHALRHYETVGDTVGRSQTLRFIGQTHLDRGDPAAALEVLRSARAVAGELRDPRPVAQADYWIGQACLAAGDLAGAAAAFDALLEVYGEPAGLGHAYAAHGLGDVALRTGRLADAERYLSLAARLASEGFDAGLEGLVCLSTAELHEALGQPGERLAALQRAVDIFAGCGAPYLEVRALAALARAHEGDADGEAARAAWARVDDLYSEMGVPAQDRLDRQPTDPAS